MADISRSSCLGEFIQSGVSINTEVVPVPVATKGVDWSVSRLEVGVSRLSILSNCWCPE